MVSSPVAKAVSSIAMVVISIAPVACPNAIVLISITTVASSIAMVSIPIATDRAISVRPASRGVAGAIRTGRVAEDTAMLPSAA